MKQKNIYNERILTQSLSEVFITDTQEPSKQEQIQRWMFYIFKKGKNSTRTELWFWKFKFCSKLKRMIKYRSESRKKMLKKEKNLYQNLNQQTKLKPD